MQEVRRQLYSIDDDRTFFDWIQKELRAVERRLEDGRAVLAHLEGALINVSCNDPGAVVGQQLALPILQERLDGKAREYAAQRAAAAEEAIIKEEVGSLPFFLDTPWVPHSLSVGTPPQSVLDAGACWPYSRHWLQGK